MSVVTRTTGPFEPTVSPGADRLPPMHARSALFDVYGDLLPSRDEVTTLLRDLGKKLREDDRLLPLLLPVGDGLFVAVRR